MSRQKTRKEQVSAEHMSKYSQRKFIESEMSDPLRESSIKLVDELKAFLKVKLQTLGSDLKELQQEVRSLNLKFAQKEGKLQGLEKSSHQTEAEIRILTRKFEVTEDITKVGNNSSKPRTGDSGNWRRFRGYRRNCGKST